MRTKKKNTMRSPEEKEASYIKEMFPEYQGVIEYKIYDIETSKLF